MIVKILRKSKTFKAVRYNTGKVESGKGELLKISGFNALSSLSNMRPEDYINYLAARSSLNTRITYPQFHAMISAKGKSMDSSNLQSLAEDWLQGMGYDRQPYLLIFHKDTKNNHIHIVSTRIDENGEKISDKFEHIRAYKVLNRLISNDVGQNASKAVANAMKYNFSTPSQFSMILERMGYSLRPAADHIDVFKYGIKVHSVDLLALDRKIKDRTYYKDRERQLKAVFEKYHSITVRKLYPIKPDQSKGPRQYFDNYTSDLSSKLSSILGIEFIFHFKDGKPPYGYSIIDHKAKQVYKGGSIMDLKRFTDTSGFDKGELQLPDDRTGNISGFEYTSQVSYDSGNARPFFEQTSTEPNEYFNLADLSFDIEISDDIDDEQINGRNRKRQRKARTNTR